MGTIKTFENEFTSLCELLGENPSKLFLKMGQYDDIDENESRSFVSYKKNYSQIGFNKENVFLVCMPKIDSYGHSLETKDEYYTYKGLHLGMSKEEVIATWGEPINYGDFYWIIEKITLSNGNDVNVYLSFSQEDEEIEEYYLSGFEARLVEKEPFNQLFIKICDCVGCDETQIIKSFGNPDKTTTSNDGSTNVLFYLSIDTMFVIPLNLGVVKRAASPITLTNDRIESEYYNLDDVYLGYTKDQVYQIWGNPTESTDRVWVFGDRILTTVSGKQVELELTFKDDILEDFTGNLVMPKTQNTKNKSGCFVATACYGDYNATEVLVLRNYRDNVLLKNNLGKIAVDIYYFISPPIAKILEKSESLKAFVRKNILAPIILRIRQNQK